MIRSKQQFDEIRVFEGVAERTGTVVDRQTIRGSGAVCGSVRELARKFRSAGDGTFYLPVLAWPEGVTRLELSSAWVPIA
jgi:hypothetical protein